MTKSIFDYTDYRNFLRDHSERLKKQNPKWSFGWWSKRLGLANTGVITNIVNGHRHPGSQILDKLVRDLKMNKPEETYFRNLVLLAKTKENPELSQLVLQKLENSHPTKHFALIEESAFQAVAKPHYYAIREIVNLKNFEKSATWIQDRLRIKVSKPEIKRAIKDLLSLGMLKESTTGKIDYHKGSMRTSTDVASEALRQFHESMISLAEKSIREIKIEERDITGCTFSISKSDLPQIKKEIANFRMRIMNQFEKLGNGDEVYQLNVQLFPLTKNIKGALDNESEK